MFTELSQKIYEEAMEKGGRMRLDFSNEMHFEYFMEQFGGEAQMQQQYQNMYQAACLTKASHQNRPICDANEQKECPFEGIMIETVTTQKNSDGNGGAFSSAHVSYFEPVPCALLHTELYLNNDGPTPRYIGDSREFLTNEQEKTCNLSGIYRGYTGGKKREFIQTALLTAGEECNGKMQLQADVAAIKTFTVDSEEEMIQDFSVIQPQIKPEHKKDLNHTQFKVSYIRKLQVPDADYEPDVLQKDKKIALHMPVIFSLELKPGYTLHGLFEEYGYQMYFDHHDGGFIYANAPMNQFQFEYSSKNGGFNNCVKVTAPEDWKKLFDFSHLEDTAKMSCDLYGVFNLKYQKDGLFFNQPVAISSYPDDVETTTLKKIPQIFMQWGCMAADTQVAMADGGIKRADEIKIGDQVLGLDGKSHQVINISKGPEPVLYRIETKSRQIRLSAMHSVALEAEMLPAKEVRAGMKIMTQDGLEIIQAVTCCPYNGLVYNFMFQEETVLYGDGIAIGDYALQQRIRAPRAQAPAAMSVEGMAIMEEMRRFCDASEECLQKAGEETE